MDRRTSQSQVFGRARTQAGVRADVDRERGEPLTLCVRARELRTCTRLRSSIRVFVVDLIFLVEMNIDGSMTGWARGHGRDIVNISAGSSTAPTTGTTTTTKGWGKIP
jgi:hypothetical protein